MPSTSPTGAFCAGEDCLEISGEVDGIGINGSIEARPSGSGVEFGGCGEKWRSASSALECSRGVFLNGV